MSKFEKMLDDIKRGENIDLYVTALAAIVLAAMNLFGIVPVSSLSALILALLGLLSVALLGNRYRLEELSRLISAVSGQTAAFVNDFPSDLGANLEAAREVWLIGTHHSAALTAYYQVFHNKLRGGGNLRFLLVDPDGAASKMAAMRFPGRVGAEQEVVRIRSSLETLSALREMAPDRVKIRIIDFPVDYTAFVLDPELPSATIYLERYTYKTSGGSRKPKFVFRKRDTGWFEHVTAEIANLWDSATEWQPQISRSPL